MQKWLPIINYEQCTACGLCATQCPTNAVQMVNSIPDFVQPELCTYCGICEEICPSNAVNLVYEISIE